MSQRLTQEAEISQKLDELKALGLGVFAGSFPAKQVFENGKPWKFRATVVLVAPTNDPRIKRETDGTEFITGAIPKKCGGNQNVEADSDINPAATASSAGKLNSIAPNVEALLAKLSDSQKETVDVEREEPEPSTTQSPRYTFEKKGSQWEGWFDGGHFYLIDSLGAKYLDYLLHHPKESIRAFDLEIAIRPEKAGARPKNSIQNDLDSHAIHEYLRDLDRLRNERDKAKEDADESKIEGLDEQIEFIETALEKKRQFPDTGEQARDNVRKAIGAVREKLRKGNKYGKAFGKHIEQFVDTGYECIYKQPEGRIWK